MSAVGDPPQPHAKCGCLLGPDLHMNLHMTDAEVAEFQRNLQQARRWNPQVLTPPPLLSPGELRQMLREAVHVVGPGEVLVIGVRSDFAPQDLQDLQNWVEIWLAHNAPGVKALVTPAEDITIVTPAADPTPAS